MLCRKGNLHDLVALCETSDLYGEVSEKLDELLTLLQPATS